MQPDVTPTNRFSLTQGIPSWPEAGRSLGFRCAVPLRAVWPRGKGELLSTSVRGQNVLSLSV